MTEAQVIAIMRKPGYHGPDNGRAFSEASFERERARQSRRQHLNKLLESKRQRGLPTHFESYHLKQIPKDPVHTVMVWSQSDGERGRNYFRVYFVDGKVTRKE